MSYRENMQTNYSKGERMLDEGTAEIPDLKKLRLQKDTIILFYSNKRGYKITDKTWLLKTEVDKAQKTFRHPFTIPDQLYDKNGEYFAVYVDGVMHRTPHNSKRDDEINMMLIERGVRVLRLDYTTTKGGIREQVEEVKRFVLEVS